MEVSIHATLCSLTHTPHLVFGEEGIRLTVLHCGMAQGTTRQLGLSSDLTDATLKYHTAIHCQMSGNYYSCLSVDKGWAVYYDDFSIKREEVKTEMLAKNELRYLVQS